MKDKRKLFKDLKDSRAFSVLKRRSQGEKLVPIGKDLGVTRERVRQIEVKAIEEAYNSLEKLVIDLYTDEPRVLCGDLIVKEYGEDTLLIIKYVFSKSNDSLIKYSNILDRIYITENIETTNFDNVIKDTINKDEYTEEELHSVLCTLLSENNIIHNNNINIEEAMNNLNYIKKNDTFFKGSITITGSIRHYFKKEKCSIKTSDQGEMDKLAKTLLELYGIDVSSDRALLVRIQETLMLTGPAEYSSPNILEFSDELIDDMSYFISKMENDRITYRDLFLEFEERLLSETTITNYNFLHGALRKLEEAGYNFKVSRYYVHKLDSETLGSKSYYLAIADFIRSAKKPVLREVILNEFNYMNELSLLYTTNYFNDIVPWDSHHLYSVRGINYLSEEKTKLLELLKETIENNSGYTSSHFIFKETEDKMPGLLDRNCIDNPRKLFYVLEYLSCSDESLLFTLPHIVKDNIEAFNMDDLSAKVYPFRNLIDKDKLEDSIMSVFGVKNSSFELSVKQRLDRSVRLDDRFFFKKKTLKERVDDELMLNMEEVINNNYKGLENLKTIGFKWTSERLENVYKYMIKERMVE